MLFFKYEFILGILSGNEYDCDMISVYIAISLAVAYYVKI